jgi:hypothetical protein
LVQAERQKRVALGEESLRAQIQIEAALGKAERFRYDDSKVRKRKKEKAFCNGPASLATMTRGRCRSLCAVADESDRCATSAREFRMS